MLALPALAFGLVLAVGRSTPHSPPRTEPRPAALSAAAAGASSPVTPAVAAITPPPGVLRVCADPNNLPYSNSKGEGFGPGSSPLPRSLPATSG